MFTKNTAPLGEIIEECGLKRQTYADDTGLYHSISPTDPLEQNDTIKKIENCIDKVKDFLFTNKLKVNDDKTIFMLLGTKYWLSKLNLTSIKIGNTHIKPVDSTKNLGVIFDKEMSLNEHVNYICKRGFFHVRDLFSLRRFLSEDDTNTAAHAFVTFILDYGNSLLHGISVSLFDKLQVVQNSAVRAVKRRRKLDHISEDRMNLNWLPVETRIKFKLLLLTWKCIHDNAPRYLQDLIRVRSSNRMQYADTLIVPKTKQATHGDISFAKVAPELWNSLPSYMRAMNKITQFKKSLKTHLFNIYGNQTRLSRRDT